MWLLPPRLISAQLEHLGAAWRCAARGEVDCVLAETRQLELNEFGRRVPNEMELEGKTNTLVK